MFKKTLSDPLVFLFGKIVPENIIPVTRNADGCFFVQSTGEGILYKFIIYLKQMINIRCFTLFHPTNHHLG